MSKYYSFDRIDNEFRVHDTCEEAKASAENFLQLWRDEAKQWGWPEFMHYMIGYGKVIGISIEKELSKEENLDFNSAADYEIEEIK